MTMAKVADAETVNRILVIGGTGYIGKYIARASASLGYPTFVLLRPSSSSPPPHSPNHLLLREFKASGIRILLGSLDDHDSLVEAIRQVDIVISAVGMPQHLDQLNIINAIKQVGTIKVRFLYRGLLTLSATNWTRGYRDQRFVPSEFGMEVDRVATLPPFEPFFEARRKIRRAVEDAGIPYTFVAANAFLAYFVDYILHPRQKNPPPEEVIIYGDGLKKVVWTFEGDVGALTVKAVNDPRTVNRIVVCRPPANVLTQTQVVSLWEKKTGRTLKRTFVSEEELVRLSENLPHPENLPVCVLHSIFAKGVTDFPLGEEDLEAFELYGEYEYTEMEQFLDICRVSPPETKLASFV